MSLATQADQHYEIKIGSVRNVAVDCRGWLDTDEALTGTPTVTIGAGGGTLANKIVSAEALTIDDQLVPAGKAVQFNIDTDGATAGEYTITVSCATDAVPAQEPMGELLLTLVE
jgi:hypothetical protein